jgi:hypothetical protein
MRSASVESAANADRVIAAALRRVPTSARLAVLRELHVKHLPIFFRFNKIPHIAPEIFRERKASRCRNEVLFGAPAEIPRRETPRGKLALAVTRGHQQHESVHLATFDPFQLFGNLPMQAGRLVPGIRVAGEVN